MYLVLVLVLVVLVVVVVVVVFVVVVPVVVTRADCGRKSPNGSVITFFVIQTVGFG